MEKYIKGKINMSFLKFIKQNTQDGRCLYIID